MPSAPRTRSLALVLALGVALLAGCATLLPKLKAPQLSVTSLALHGGNVQRQRIRVGLHAVNPNDRDIVVDRIDCHLEISGADFAEGATESPFTLPSRGESDFVLDVTANLANAMVALMAAMNHSTVEYRLYGQVHLKSGLLRTVPFDQHGHVRL